MIESKIFVDGKGKISSKRITGIVTIGLAVVMSITLFIYSIQFKAVDPSTGIDIIKYLLMTGGALLGVGIFEKKK